MPHPVTLATAIVAASLLLACASPSTAPPRSQATGKDGAASADEQAAQRAWLDKAMELGTVAKATPGPSAELWTGPRWHGLSYDDKTKVAAGVAAWCFKVPKGGSLRDDEVLVIIDNKTGNTIGTFSKSGGLSLN